MGTYILVGMLGTNFTCDSLCPLLRVQGQTFCAFLQRFPVAMEHRMRSATLREFGIIRILRILPCNRQGSMRHKIHRFWSRFCFHRLSIVRKTFQGSFRHDNALPPVWDKEKAARDCRENHDIGQVQKMAPLILREATFGLACLPFGFRCQTYLIWILGPKLLLSNN